MSVAMRGPRSRVSGGTERPAGCFGKYERPTSIDGERGHRLHRRRSRQWNSGNDPRPHRRCAEQSDGCGAASLRTDGPFQTFMPDG
jgi:hypothetical protein